MARHKKANNHNYFFPDSYSGNRTYDNTLTFNLASKKDGSMYYAGCHGSHVYHGKDEIELAKNVAIGILNDAYTGSEMKIKFQSGDVYVRNGSGKGKMKDTVHQERIGRLAIDVFGAFVSGYIRDMLDDRFKDNAKKTQAFNEAERNRLPADYFEMQKVYAERRKMGAQEPQKEKERSQDAFPSYWNHGW